MSETKTPLRPQTLFAEWLRAAGKGSWVEVPTPPLGFGAPTPTDLQFFRLFADAIISGADGLSQPHPYVEFIHNATFNALAVDLGEHQFIGINHGLVSIVMNTCLRLLAHPTFMAGIGDPMSLGVSNVPPGPLPIDAFEVVPCTTKVDLPRVSYALSLFEKIALSTTLHEAAHLYHGHLRLPGSLRTQENVRAMEYDADMAAGYNTLHVALTHPSQFEERTGVRQSPYERLKMWFMGNYIAFRLNFNREKPSDPSEWRSMLLDMSTTHPPPPFRLHLLMIGAAQWIGDKRLPLHPLIAQDQAFIANVDAMQEIERALAALVGSSFDVEWFKQISSILPEGGEYVRCLNDAWASIHGELQQRARVKIQTPQPDSLERVAQRSKASRT